VHSLSFVVEICCSGNKLPLSQLAILQSPATRPNRSRQLSSACISSISSVLVTHVSVCFGCRRTRAWFVVGLWAGTLSTLLACLCRFAHKGASLTAVHPYPRLARVPRLAVASGRSATTASRRGATIRQRAVCRHPGLRCPATTRPCRPPRHRRRRHPLSRVGPVLCLATRH